jgi:hypothetical protein
LSDREEVYDRDITDAILGPDCGGAAFVSGVLGLAWALERRLEGSPLAEAAIHRVLELRRRELRPILRLAHDALIRVLQKRKDEDPQFLPRLILWQTWDGVIPYPPQPRDFFSRGEFKDLSAEHKVLVSGLRLSPDTRVLHATHIPDFISMIKTSGSGLKIKVNCSRRGQYAHTPLCWFGVDLESGNTEAFEAFEGTHVWAPDLPRFTPLISGHQVSTWPRAIRRSIATVRFC